MYKWENNSLGKDGKYFHLLYLVPIPVLLMSIFFLYFTLIEGFKPFERVIFLIFGLAFAYYTYKGLKLILTSRNVVKSISYKEGNLCLVAFGGTKISQQEITEIYQFHHNFPKKSAASYVLSDKINLAVQTKNGIYLISGNMENFDNLSGILYRLIDQSALQRNSH